jgi:hypothetical protein
VAREIKVALLGDTRSLERAFSKAGKSGGTFSSGMGKVGHGLGTVVKGAALAGAAVGALGVIIGTKLVQDMASQQQMSVQTNTVIASTGQAANVTRKHVEDLASAIANKSGLDDQAVQSGENMLLTFTNIRNETGKGNKVFDQSTKILADMSVALGQDMSKSAIQLGKALNDPVKGMSALQRVGVTFTEGQKKTVAAMVKAGNTIGAQKLILHELNKEFGGSALAAGQTLPGKLNILKGRLMDLGTSMAAGIMPHLSHLVGFLNRVVAAPNMSVRMKIIWDGIKEFAENAEKVIGDALFGSSHVVHIRGAASSVVVDPGIVAGIKARIESMMATTDWDAVGRRIGAGIGKAIKIGDDALNKILSSITAWVGSHRAKLADLGAQMLAAIVIKLTDPAFWAKHWDLAIGVALAVGPGKFGKLGLKIGELIVKPLGTLGAKIGGALAEAFVSAAEKVGPKAGLLALHAVLLLEKGLVAGGKLVGKAALALGRGIVERVGAGLNKLGFIAKVLISTALVQSIAAAAIAAYNGAVHLGGRIVSGVVDGLKGLPGALKSKIEGTLSSVLSHINVPGFSPPEHAAAQAIGNPLGRGVILGFLAGSRDLPEKIGGKLKASLESARNRIDGLRAGFATSFGRLGADAMSAFDATTTKKLDVIARKFDNWRRDATNTFEAVGRAASKAFGIASKGIDDAGSALTPHEQQLQDLQSGHDQAGRDADMARGQADLAAATTPEEQAAAQKEIDDAVYNQRIFDLGVLAAAERAAKDAATVIAQQKLQDDYDEEERRRQAAYDAQNSNWEIQQAKETLDLQSRRDLRKRHLEDMLADLQENLDKNPKAWRKNHAKIMKIFEDDFGPDFKAAGGALGTGFREQLIEDFKVTGDLLGNVGAAIKNALSPENQAAVAAAADKTNPKKMAVGGIVTRPTLALIGEAGPEAVIPLSGGGGSGGGGGGGVVINITGMIGDEQVEQLRNILIRRGRNTTGGALGGFA